MGACKSEQRAAIGPSVHTMWETEFFITFLCFSHNILEQLLTNSDSHHLRTVRKETSRKVLLLCWTAAVNFVATSANFSSQFSPFFCLHFLSLAPTFYEEQPAKCVVRSCCQQTVVCGVPTFELFLKATFYRREKRKKTKHTPKCSLLYHKKQELDSTSAELLFLYTNGNVACHRPKRNEEKNDHPSDSLANKLSHLIVA